MSDEPAPPILETRVGRALFDDHEHHGHRVFRDLVGRETYTGLLALAVTGRRMSAGGVAMLDDVAGCMTIAEPRIWPMKVTRLAASYGRVVPAALAGALCFESDLIGPMTSAHAARDLLSLRDATDAALDDGSFAAVVREFCAARGRLIGFGVPFRPRDERVVALTARVQARGRAALPAWTLATRTWAVLRAERGLEPNIASAIAAVGLDLGLSAQEIGALCVALLQNIFWANAVEGARQAPPVLRRLPDAHVEYVGPPPRQSPAARAKREP